MYSLLQTFPKVLGAWDSWMLVLWVKIKAKKASHTSPFSMPFVTRFSALFSTGPIGFLMDEEMNSHGEPVLPDKTWITGVSTKNIMCLKRWGTNTQLAQSWKGAKAEYLKSKRQRQLQSNEYQVEKNFSSVQHEMVADINVFYMLIKRKELEQIL